MGQHAPFAPLVLSLQHRVLLAQSQSALLDVTGDPLVPAKALTGMPGVRRMRGHREQVRHHFALSRHAVVQANGLWVESLLLGPQILAGLQRMEQLRLRAAFPRPGPGDTPFNGPPARPMLSDCETRALLGTEARRAVQPIRTL